MTRDPSLSLPSHSVAAVGAHTSAIEAIPFEKGEGIFGMHQILSAMKKI